MPEWLQKICAFVFFVSICLLGLGVDRYGRLKKEYYALRNYKLTHEHPEIHILGGMGEGEIYVSTIEKGQKFVCFFTSRSDARRFWANTRKNGLTAHFGELIDDYPTFPDSQST